MTIADQIFDYEDYERDAEEIYLFNVTLKTDIGIYKKGKKFTHATINEYDNEICLSNISKETEEEDCRYITHYKIDVTIDPKNMYNKIDVTIITKEDKEMINISELTTIEKLNSYIKVVKEQIESIERFILSRYESNQETISHLTREEKETLESLLEFLESLKNIILSPDRIL